MKDSSKKQTEDVKEDFTVSSAPWLAVKGGDELGVEVATECFRACA